MFELLAILFFCVTGVAFALIKERLEAMSEAIGEHSHRINDTIRELPDTIECSSEHVDIELYTRMFDCVVEAKESELSFLREQLKAEIAKSVDITKKYIDIEAQLALAKSNERKEITKIKIESEAKIAELKAMNEVYQDKIRAQLADLEVQSSRPLSDAANKVMAASDVIIQRNIDSAVARVTPPIAENNISNLEGSSFRRFDGMTPDQIVEILDKEKQGKEKKRQVKVAPPLTTRSE